MIATDVKKRLFGRLWLSDGQLWWELRGRSANPYATLSLTRPLPLRWRWLDLLV